MREAVVFHHSFFSLYQNYRLDSFTHFQEGVAFPDSSRGWF
jgi:hypothetical protein